MGNRTIQQLADSLGLSRVTVWKVLNHRPGVSPETSQRVWEAVNPGADKDTGTLVYTAPQKNVALVSSRTDTSTFWTRIVDQVASILNQHKIRMSYYPLEAMEITDSELISELNVHKPDGLLVINNYDIKTLNMLSRLDVPSVYFDAAPGCSAGKLNGDLVLLEGKRTISAITSHLINRGFTKIGFIGDAEYAITYNMRFEGFKEAMRQSGMTVNFQHCLTAMEDRDDYRKSIELFLSKLVSMPEVFICANDYTAFLVNNLLPFYSTTPTILTGYDDSNEFMLDHYGITTVGVQNSMIGKCLVRQLLFRMENPDADPEEISIFPKIIYRDGASHF